MQDETALERFVLGVTGTRTLPSPDCDLFTRLGIYGGDAGDFIQNFARDFDIDMSGYLWYFHHEDEGGINPGGLFFTPPYRRVSRIPITLDLLAEAVTLRRWPQSYPLHSLPLWRYDLMVNAAIGMTFLLGVTAAIVMMLP